MELYQNVFLIKLGVMKFLLNVDENVVFDPPFVLEWTRGSQQIIKC